MEYCGYCLKNADAKLQVGDELLYGDKKMLFTEFHPDGTFTFEVKTLENGKWIDHHETSKWKAFLSELEERNKQPLNEIHENFKSCSGVDMRVPLFSE